MTPPRLSDLGSYYVDPEGEVWRLVLFCEEPTATLECVTGEQTGKRVGGAAAAPIFDPFVKLIPEGEADPQRAAARTQARKLREALDRTADAHAVVGASDRAARDVLPRGWVIPGACAVCHHPPHKHLFGGVLSGREIVYKCTHDGCSCAAYKSDSR